MGYKRNKDGVHKKSLGDALENPETHGVRVYPHKKARNQLPQQQEDEEWIDTNQSSKILALAKEQQQEQAREQANAASAADIGVLESALNRFSRKEDSESEDGSDFEGADIHVDDLAPFSGEDEAAFNAFMPEGSTQGGKLLSDLIAAKLKQRVPESGEGEIDGEAVEAEDDTTEGMERIYEDVGKLLSRYTAGKLPKAFKVIPHLKNWEEVLFMTSPQSWSPHATLCATKMFVSQLNTKQVQRFLNLILLNKVRDDIRENKRLHFALFQAVKKAVFKAGAFYKGFVLPLLKQGDCTLREAVILSAVLNRVSVPMDHSAAALMRMADLPYSGVTSFMIKTLLDKKYALPYRTVDALVDHFMGFHKEERSLPVIWHLSLLTFVQRYKQEIRVEDKVALRQLIKQQYHHAVTPEIVQDLSLGHSRGEGQGVQAVGERKLIPTGNTEQFKRMAQVVVEDMEY